MVSVEEAHALMEEHCHALSHFSIPLRDAYSYVLAENIISPVNIPPFNQSAMDGYALHYADLKLGDTLDLVGEVPAGGIWHQELAEGQCVRIFTGAAVPDSADIVVEQERVFRQGDKISIRQEGLQIGANIRATGSQILSGEVALESGTLLNPASIGFLAGMGIHRVNVFRKPEIAIVITGNELQEPGTELTPGNIYESNSMMLNAALLEAGFPAQHTVIVRDDEDDIEIVFNRFAGKVDVLLFTGGISVGDYDLIRKKLENSEVENVFYKVKQKPGKPFWFGLSGKTKLFALPGNPAAVLTCFYEYVYPALRKMTGHHNIHLPSRKAALTTQYKKKSGLAHFLKGRMNGSEVTLLSGQESYKLNSFALADCLVYIPQEIEYLPEGETVEVHLLPSC